MRKKIAVRAGIALAAFAGILGMNVPNAHLVTFATPDYSAVGTAASDQLASVPSLVSQIIEPVLFVVLVIGAMALLVNWVRRVVRR